MKWTRNIFGAASLAVAFAISLSGCANGGAIQSAGSAVAVVTGPAPIAGSTAVDEKLWYAAEAAYNVPAQAYVDALNRKVLTPDLKSIVKPKLQAAKKALDAATTAYRIGDATTFSARYAELLSLKAQIMPFFPGAK